MNRIIPGAFLVSLIAGALLAGCNTPSDVTSTEVRDKENQAEDATRKLNGGKLQNEGQNSDQQSGQATTGTSAH